MLLADHDISLYVFKYEMITPFCAEQVRFFDQTPCISYGLGSFGYDATMAPEIKVVTGGDPKNAETGPKIVIEDAFVLQPGEHILTRTFEYFRIPPTVLGLVFGKSTYARAGLIVNATPLEPGWEGYITLSLINPTNHPVTLYPNEGIVQVVFMEGPPPKVTYRDRGGKYQGQQEITHAKV